MDIKFSKIPTADEIAEMKNEPEVWKTYPAVLEGEMLTTAEAYQTWETKRVELQAKFDAAYAKFQEENQSLIDGLTEAKTEASVNREFLQQAAVARRLLTGDKTWKAFQAAEVWKPVYDAGDMYNWVLHEAPGDVRRNLLDLNPKTLNTLLLERGNEQGVIELYEGCEAMPAFLIKAYTGKVMAKELEALVADKPSETIPVKIIEPVGEPFTIRVVDSIRLLTQDEVKKTLAGDIPSAFDELLAPSETALKRLSETPTPIDPIPAVVVEETDKIPF